MKTIAVCTNIPEFDRGEISWDSPRICDRYPGSHFVRYLQTFGEAAGYEVLSGAQISDQEEKYVKSEVFVVQEENNPIGERLVALGCNASVVYCLESPLFAPFFYDAIPQMKKIFKSQILYGDLGNSRAYFPSFDEDTPLEAPIPYLERKHAMCAVVSNKHFRQYEGIFSKSPSWRLAVDQELHTARYSILTNLKTNTDFDLFGKGWPAEFAQEIPPGDKIKVIRNYNTAICSENITYPGYVTEKIIDCLVAGVIPVYLGAPDICSYVPNDCFLTLWSDLNQTHLKSMPERGHDFLKSEGGRRFSYQSFAKQIVSLL